MREKQSFTLSETRKVDFLTRVCSSDDDSFVFHPPGGFADAESGVAVDPDEEDDNNRKQRDGEQHR